MKGELLDFVSRFELDPFSSSKTLIKRDQVSIYKTTDAKKIHNRVIERLSRGFVFKETSNLWNFFNFVDNFSDIKVRQEFFSRINNVNRGFLSELKKPRQTWDPDYDIVVVTEDEETFVELRKLNCPVQLIVNENDLSDLERYDIVQVVDCETFGGILEKLPQSVFFDEIENVFLERFLQQLSSWKYNFEILKRYTLSDDLNKVIEKLKPLFNLIDIKVNKSLNVEDVEKILENINESINVKIRDMTISGDSLIRILGEGKMPEIFVKIIEDALDESGLPRSIFVFKIPVEIDYAELEAEIKRKNSNKFTNLAENIKKYYIELKEIPGLLERLSNLLILEDFYFGIIKFLDKQIEYPIISENLHFSKSENMFLENPQPIDFQLDSFSRCSILTGANSGGKTTLLEHVLQNISLFQFGLPIVGEIHMPIFSDIYYFAKNKGSANKGAFETLLTQMSKIKPGAKTLILADEIEAVTEPGVAGKIIAATADFFIRRNCFLIIATHLGYEIQSCLPEKSRIDGIEAKGLDEKFNLIVDHNPVMGRLAHSTPELIVEKMSKTFESEYFTFLNEKVKSNTEI